MPVASGFGIEVFHVVVEHEGFGGGDQIATVSETFAVGAVRLHAEQVAKERPFTHRLDAVELVVGTREEPYWFHGGVHAKALDVLQRESGWKAGEFDVSEGMERETGRVSFRATAPSNVGIGLPGDGGRPVRPRILTLYLAAYARHWIERAIFVQQLAIAYLDFRPPRDIEVKTGDSMFS